MQKPYLSAGENSSSNWRKLRCVPLKFLQYLIKIMLRLQGIGYQIVLALAGRGCRVILADKDNSEASRNRIIAQTNNPHVINKHLDLANFQSIRTFAEDITKTEAKLDILINNAGIIFPLSLQTIDGLDRLMQVNHLGPFLLTHLLIDLLKVSLPSRIIFSSSASAFTHTLSTENFLALTKESIRSQFATYVNSKLCNLITVKVLAEKMKNTGITVNSAHPGVVLTNIYDTAYKSIAYCWPNKITKHIFPLILPIFKFFGKVFLLKSTQRNVILNPLFCRQ